MNRSPHRILIRSRRVSPASVQLLPLLQPLLRSPGHLLFPVQSSSPRLGRAYNRSRR